MSRPDDATGDGALPGVALPDGAVLAVDPDALLRALPSMPDGLNAVLRLADGRRTVAEAAAASGLAPDAAREAIRRLVATGALRLVEAKAGSAAGLAPSPGTPEPQRVDWFAQPADPEPADPEAEPPAEAAVEPSAPAPVDPPPAPITPQGAPAPARSGSPRTWLLVAAVLVAAAVVAGVVARSGAGPGAPPAASAGGPAPAAPPALSMTEPGPGATVGEALARARERLAAGDPTAAAAACRRAIELDPASGPAWALLGEAHLAAGDPARARAAFERSLAVDPGGPEAAAARLALARLRP